MQASLLILNFSHSNYFVFLFLIKLVTFEIIAFNPFSLKK